MLPPILDCHVHWRDPVTNPYEALSDGVDADGQRGESSAQTYLPRDHLSAAAGVRLAGFVHIEAEWDKSDPVRETKWLHSLLKTTEMVDKSVAIVGYADLSQDGGEAVLEARAHWPNARGIRHILNRLAGRPALCWADQDYLENPIWRRNFKRLAAYDLVFDLMCFTHQLAPMAKLAAEAPQTHIHLERAALPWDHSPGGRDDWRRAMRDFAALDQVDVKISGLDNTIPNWDIAAIRDYVLDTIDIFGTKRVSFASNFPTDATFSSMGDIWSAFDTITAGFTDTERHDLFARNAARAYRMDGF